MIEFVGKFYDNHSLSIVNRNIVLNLPTTTRIKITALDSYDPRYKLAKEDVKKLKDLEKVEVDKIDVQVRHTYPPIWNWPSDPDTKIIYIQPWEYTKAPFEWQYKFETFADALIVPSTFCKNVFLSGGLNPENLFIVPNGYDNTIFNQDNLTSNKKFTFVYVGNSQWRKGLDILLNAWAVAFKKFDNVKLIIKDNPRVYGASNILSETIKLQYNTSCAEIEYIDDDLTVDEMANLYKNSSAIVHPYRAEGFGMHVQEAVACGCIPLVSAQGPTDDFIPDSIGVKIAVTTKAMNIQDPKIFALKPGDSTTLMSTHTFYNEPSQEHLTKAMMQLYHNHFRNDAVKKAREYIPTNTWASVAERYNSIFDKVSARDKIVRKREK